LSLDANRFLVRQPDGALFRVYVHGGILSFVKVAGRDRVRNVLSHLPIVGGLLLAAWDARARAALLSRLASDDRRNVRALLARDPDNFRVAAHQVAAAALDAEDPALAPRHQGVLRIDTRSRSIVFLLENAHEMSAAVGLLRESLGSLFVSRAVWSTHRKRYVSERAYAMSLRAFAGGR
jgi:hypothetical protein